MPNAKVLSEKQAIVAALTEKLQNAAAGVIVDYKGITVAEDTALRADCREARQENAQRGKTSRAHLSIGLYGIAGILSSLFPCSS